MAPPDVRRGGVDSPEGYWFEITGGNLALDLSNTVDGRPTPSPRELLRDWTDLVRWSEQAGAVEAAAAKWLQKEGPRRPEEALAVLRRVRFLREVLYRIFAALAAGGPAPSRDLEALNDALPLCLQRLRLARAGQAFRWSWRHPDGAIDCMLPPVIHAASVLLRDADLLKRVRACEAEDTCRWLFLDLSRNRSRRWCDMSVCGNREKARRHHQKLSRRTAGRRAPAH